MDIKDWPCWAKVGLSAGLAVFILNWPTSSAEWAAWVQAIGSIGAVGVAVYVLRKQHENTIRVEKKRIAEEERRLSQALRSELEVRWGQYMWLIGDEIESDNLKRKGAFEWKTPDNPFHIFMGNTGKIGVIGCDRLRAKIINTYALLEGLLLTIHTLRETLTEVAVNGIVCFDEPLNEQYVAVLQYHELTKKDYEECLALIKDATAT